MKVYRVKVDDFEIFEMILYKKGYTTTKGWISKEWIKDRATSEYVYCIWEGSILNVYKYATECVDWKRRLDLE